ncbi:MAG: SRPBCC domain-containing protein [Saprospiraceae bacterium]|nr:SRPBCC domain-containing protein [Saprospiraceae bacterium]
MTPSSDRDIVNSRILEAPVETVYNAFADPGQLKIWWGPEGFTNTIHQFDLCPGGKWLLTMHGTNKGHYENSSVFTSVEPLRLVTWTRVSKPHFDMEVGFEAIDARHTQISFRMIFSTPEECEKMRPFVEPKNEENFDRLERLLRYPDQA